MTTPFCVTPVCALEEAFQSLDKFRRRTLGVEPDLWHLTDLMSQGHYLVAETLLNLRRQSSERSALPVCNSPVSYSHRKSTNVVCPGTARRIIPTMNTILLLALSALLVGVLIGCVGIGGILLPLALTYLGGLDLHLAMATAMWSFFLTGIAGTVSYARHRSLNWRMVAWLSAGIVPAAVLGARSNLILSEDVLTGLLAVLLVATGADTLLRRRAAGPSSGSPGTLALLSVGMFVGFGSSLTGTGGPVILVPILLLLRTPILVAVGVSQGVQIPVAASATFGYVLYGQTDFALGTALGIVEVVGVVIGTRIAHYVPASRLRMLVAVALITAGLVLIVRTVEPAVEDKVLPTSALRMPSLDCNKGASVHRTIATSSCTDTRAPGAMGIPIAPFELSNYPLLCPL
jgi:uncharacterized protein